MSQEGLVWHVVTLPETVSRTTSTRLHKLAEDLSGLSAGERAAGKIESLRDTILNATLQSVPEQVPARVAASVLCDLAAQGWGVQLREGKIQIQQPTAIGGNALAEKERVRSGHIVERNRQLLQEPIRRFVRTMEESRLFKGSWVSVFSLMRDGQQLAASLRAAEQRGLSDTSLATCVDPYIQAVDSDSKCEFTGLRLMDVWRYFRFTWSTAHHSVPGRRMLLLIRDRAAPCHPIIGIAALGSSIVQLSVRDEWIGWTSDAFLNATATNPTIAIAKWIVRTIDECVADVYVKDFVREGLIARRELRNPSIETLDRLTKEVSRARSNHERYPRQTDYKASSGDASKIRWEEQARSFLFRSKRAAALVSLLRVRLVLAQNGMVKPSKAGLARVFATAAGRSAIGATVRAAKARHVGIDMLDITVCGAVAPYTHVLGGKLVSLLMCSPEIVSAYQARYRHSASVIASAVSGSVVSRKPRLVLMGTTSLYGVSSSQYNRLRIPIGDLEGHASSDLQYEILGRTIGFGSYHFSAATISEMEMLASLRREGRRVNSIFGEGVNPKLRKVREALDAAGFPSDALLRHGSARLVYGIALAENFRDVLFGRSKRPRYILQTDDPREGTQLIARFWRRRWLAKRLSATGILDAVETHTLARPVTHGARVHTFPEDAGLPLFTSTE